MSDLDLDAIKNAANELVLMDAEDPGYPLKLGTVASCVPLLVAELERYERLHSGESFPTSDGYENAMQALTDLRGLLVEILRYFPRSESLDLRDAVRSEPAPAVSIARWHRIAGGDTDE